MTNETFFRKKHIYVGLRIFGHILKEFMEIFQDGAFPNLEYHLFQVTYLCRCLAYLDTSYWISWKYSKMGN